MLAGFEITPGTHPGGWTVNREPEHAMVAGAFRPRRGSLGITAHGEACLADDPAHPGLCLVVGKLPCHYLGALPAG